MKNMLGEGAKNIAQTKNVEDVKGFFGKISGGKDVKKALSAVSVRSMFCSVAFASCSSVAYLLDPRTALLLRTEITILRAGKLSPLFHEVTVT